MEVENLISAFIVGVSFIMEIFSFKRVLIWFQKFELGPCSRKRGVSVFILSLVLWFQLKTNESPVQTEFGQNNHPIFFSSIKIELDSFHLAHFRLTKNIQISRFTITNFFLRYSFSHQTWFQYFDKLSKKSAYN
jgi:hypothetical protein